MFSTLALLAFTLAIKMNNQAQEIGERIQQNSIPVFSYNIAYKTTDLDYLNSLGLSYNQKSLDIYYYYETYNFTNSNEAYLLTMANTCSENLNKVLSGRDLNIYDNQLFALSSYSRCKNVFTYEIKTPNNETYKIALLETLFQFNRDSNYYTTRRLKIRESTSLVELEQTELLFEIGKRNFIQFSTNTNLNSSYLSNSYFSNKEDQRIDLMKSLSTDFSLIDNNESIYSSLTIFFAIVSVLSIYLIFYIGEFPTLKDAVNFDCLRRKRDNILRKKAKTISQSNALAKLKDLEKEMKDLI